MLIVIDPQAKHRTLLAERAGGEVTEAASRDEVHALLASRKGAPTVLMIGPGCSNAAAIELAETVRRDAHGVAVVLISDKVGTPLLRSALRAGVQDVLPAAVPVKQLREALGHAMHLAMAAPRVSPAEATPGRVVTVFSAKGGCGKSFLALNLAVEMERRSAGRVAIVDLNLESGDQGLMMRLKPRRTILDASDAVDHIDERALATYLTPFSDNVHLLAAPLEPGMGERVSTDALRRIIDMLKSSYDRVVIDGASTFTEHMLVAFDMSDDIVLVASLDVPTLKNTKLSLQTFDLLGVKRDRIRVVLNRANSGVGLSPADVEKALGLTVDVLVPSSRDVPLTINRGVPLVKEMPNSAVATSIGALADALGIASAAAKPRFRIPIGARR